MRFMVEAQLMEKSKNGEIHRMEEKEIKRTQMRNISNISATCKWSLKAWSDQIFSVIATVPFLCELLSAQIDVDYQLGYRI